MVKVQSHKWVKGDRIKVDFGGTMYGGIVQAIKKTVSIVLFDDGETHEIPIESLVRGKIIDNGDGTDEDEFVDEGDSVRFNPPMENRGMHSYPISWLNDSTAFNLFATLDADDVAITPRGDEMIARLRGRAIHFYGTVSKTSFHRRNENGKISPNLVNGYAVWMYAKVPSEDGKSYDEYTVESISYEGNHDPRSDMHSLNSDICACVRKWVLLELRGDRITLHELKRKAAQPILKVPSLHWLDNLIAKMKEVRETAVRCGGQRSIIISTSNSSEPVVALNMDFTTIAMATEGKGVRSQAAAAMDNIAASGGRKSAPRVGVVAQKVDPKNMEALKTQLAELNRKAKSGDQGAKKEARKLRAAMRDMGVTGGTRGGNEE